MWKITDYFVIAKHEFDENIHHSLDCLELLSWLWKQQTNFTTELKKSNKLTQFFV